MKTEPVKAEIGSEDWFKEVYQMAENHWAEDSGIIAFYIQSIQLSYYRESIGGITAKESTMYKEALRGLNKIAVDHGYIQNP